MLGGRVGFGRYFMKRGRFGWGGGVWRIGDVGPRGGELGREIMGGWCFFGEAGYSRDSLATVSARTRGIAARF